MCGRKASQPPLGKATETARSSEDTLLQLRVRSGIDVLNRAQDIGESDNKPHPQHSHTVNTDMTHNRHNDPKKHLNHTKGFTIVHILPFLYGRKQKQLYKFILCFKKFSLEVASERDHRNFQHKILLHFCILICSNIFTPIYVSKFSSFQGRTKSAKLRTVTNWQEGAVPAQTAICKEKASLQLYYD